MKLVSADERISALLDQLSAAGEELTEFEISQRRVFLEELLGPVLRAIADQDALNASLRLAEVASELSRTGLDFLIDLFSQELRRVSRAPENDAVIAALTKARADGYWVNRQMKRASAAYVRALDRLGKSAQPELRASIHQNLGIVHSELGEEETALTQFEEALRWARRAKSDLLVAQLTNSLGLELALKDRRRSDRLFQESLSLRGSRRGPDFTVTPVLSNWGLARVRQRRLTEAESLFRQAIRRARRAHGEHVLALRNLANVLREQRKSGEAVQVYRRALDAAHEFSDLESERHARKGLALALIDELRYQDAIEVFNGLIEDAEPLGLPDFEVAMATRDIGVANYLDGRWTDARRDFAEARDLFADLNDQRWVSECFLDESLVCKSLELDAERLDLLTRGLSSAPRSQPFELRVALLRELIDTFLSLRRFDDARETFSKERRLLKRHSREEDLLVRLREFGSDLAKVGQLRRAISLFREAARLAEKAGDRIEVLRIRNDLANSVVELGDFAQATRLYNENLRAARSMKNRYLEADALVNLGETLRRTGEIEESCEILKEAVSLFRELQNLAGLALALNNLGLALQSSNEIAAARRSFFSSRTAASKAGAHSAEARAVSSLGSLAAFEMEWPSAAELFAQAYDIAESVGDLSLMADLSLNLAAAELELDDASSAETWLDLALLQAQEAPNFDAGWSASILGLRRAMDDGRPAVAAEHALNALLFCVMGSEDALRWMTVMVGILRAHRASLTSQVLRKFTEKAAKADAEAGFDGALSGLAGQLRRTVEAIATEGEPSPAPEPG